ncbi:MAG: prepilin-type N-terminal cleavage/methylation domain-containing protein [Candidatus Sumerlaeia bacterium]|nr:prepilin-type N-terminal cleavage/methylation domain-containing protein [Candidatus Sumerlaeia bacterium]
MNRYKDVKDGFTLIELLIVVAIIAILASIAIPNFLAAQVRAKVSRAESDLRTLSVGLASYHVDRNRYPPTPMASLSDRFLRLRFLTTPIAYLTSLPMEVFQRDEPAPYAYWSSNLSDAMKESPVYFFLPEENRRRGRWSLFSRGPDLNYELAVEEGGSGILIVYDPTNGTVSNGDIMRFGP